MNKISVTPSCFCCHSNGANECVAINIVSPYSQVIEDGPSIDLHLLVEKLPKEVLAKIYMDYFRIDVMWSMYYSLLYNSKIPYRVRKAEFDRHLVYFMYTPIRTALLPYDERLDLAWRTHQKQSQATIWDKCTPLTRDVVYHFIKGPFLGHPDHNPDDVSDY
jgi:hypothetical protein